MTQAALSSDAPPDTNPGGWLAPPRAVAPLVRAGLERAADLATAEQYTRRLAHTHYENFSVVSLLLPRHLRQDFCNVYAFCRTADDLGDELGDRDASLEHLGRLRRQTLDLYAGRAEANLFVALSGTVRRHDIPAEPFLDLIDAFEQDQRVVRYQTTEQLLDYCRRSANPVGRLVLYMSGYRDPERQRLSDRTCTALQLINFWQDVRRDLLDRDRIYLPADSMARFGVTEATIREGIARGRADENFRRLLRFEVDRVAEMFADGEALLPLLRPPVRRQVALFGQGGRAVLRAIARQDYDTLARRPKLSRWQKGRLVLGGLAAAAAAAVVSSVALVSRGGGCRAVAVESPGESGRG